MSGRARWVPSTRNLVISNTHISAACAIDHARTVILVFYHAVQRWPEAL